MCEYTSIPLRNIITVADVPRSVFVNGRSRPVIFENMRERIARGDINAERKDAIKAMCVIASDRAKKLL